MIHNLNVGRNVDETLRVLEAIQMPLRLGTPTPPLAGATEWINGEPKWDHDNMPTIVEWRDAYAPRGLRVVTMHLPREEADTGVAVADAFDNRYVSYFLFARQFGDEG